MVFGVETILSSLVRQGYFLQLYFWIDVVAALSMALDVPAITNRSALPLVYFTSIMVSFYP